MNLYFEILRTCPLFHQIRQEDLAGLLTCLDAHPQQFARGETILEEGSPADALGIVLSGAVQVIRLDYYGNRSIMTKLGPGGIFAEAFACAGISALPVSVAAAENTTLMLLDARRILESCANACSFHNQLIRNLLQVMAEKNLACNRKIEITSQRSTREKLMTYLLLEAKQAGCNSFTIPYDRQELADYLEVDRSGLSAAISKLQREGVLLSQKSKFTLLRES